MNCNPFAKVSSANIPDEAHNHTVCVVLNPIKSETITKYIHESERYNRLLYYKYLHVAFIVDARLASACIL